MRRGAALMPYPEERALEHAAYGLLTNPTRIYLVLLPVWCVQVRAEVTEGEPFELIDRFLERGILEAGLATAEELTAFLALEPAVVGQALRFLTAIGHVTWSPAHGLALTGLGQRSVRDGVRYTVTREDRRMLYFDAFAGRPLTRPYYDARRVEFLSGGAAQQAVAREGGPRVHVLATTRGFRREALFDLSGSPERDRFNLPTWIERLDSVDEEQVFLPSYLVRAVDTGGRPRHLVYTAAADEADEELTAVCEGTPEVWSALEAEEVGARTRDVQDRVSRWLSGRNLASHQPVRDNHGWHVTLPANSFGADRAVPMAKLGSFVMVGTSFFRLWCDDERVRQEALVERADAYLAPRATVDRTAFAAWVDRTSRQLGFGPATVEDLRQVASRLGRRALAAQLARLIRSSRE